MHLELGNENIITDDVLPKADYDTNVEGNDEEGKNKKNNSDNENYEEDDLEEVKDYDKNKYIDDNELNITCIVRRRLGMTEMMIIHISCLE